MDKQSDNNVKISQNMIFKAKSYTKSVIGRIQANLKLLSVQYED